MIKCVFYNAYSFSSWWDSLSSCLIQSSFVGTEGAYQIKIFCYEGCLGGAERFNLVVVHDFFGALH
jgi:hypothetical protein